MTDRAADPTPAQVPLNPRQRDAVEHGDGPLAVLAGAGTGKTRVLVQRVARIVERGAEPWGVLAVTFTNKAAGEMRDRLRDLLGPDADQVWVGTFHAVCARLLRRLSTYAGLSPSFAIYDEADCLRVVERALRDLSPGDASAHEQPSARGVHARIGWFKTRGLDPAEHAGDVGHPLDGAVARVYPSYQDRLAREDACDFDDLLLRVRALCDHAVAGPLLARKFSHVLVDEFQDTSVVQFDLVRHLSATWRRLTVVGDDDQSIYAWRSAEPRNLLDFRAHFPDATVVKLEQNYRSTPQIVAAANAVIEKNAERYGKVLWTERGDGPPIEVVRSDDDREEARRVAREICRVVQAGEAKLTDCAVLYRTNAQSRVLEEALRAARVPSRVVGGISFYERREVRDALAYARLAISPGSDTAALRVVNVPARSVGDATVERVAGAAKSNRTSFVDAARAVIAGGDATGVRGRSRKGLQSFVEVVDELVAAVARGWSASALVALAIERSGLRKSFEDAGDDDARARVANLVELVTAAGDFDDDARLAEDVARLEAETRRVALVQRRIVEGGDGPGDGASAAPLLRADGTPMDPWEIDVALGTLSLAPSPAPSPVSPLAAFLERVALATPGDDAASDGVVLTTIHVAKGLEWPLVFLTGMEDGLFPSLREREDMPPDQALAEERRLAYVAVTRARDRLVMSHARTRRVYGEIQSQDPSRFLDDLPEDTVGHRKPLSIRWPWEPIPRKGA